jgi:hypothetical protein
MFDSGKSVCFCCVCALVRGEEMLRSGLHSGAFVQVTALCRFYFVQVTAAFSGLLFRCRLSLPVSITLGVVASCDISQWEARSCYSSSLFVALSSSHPAVQARRILVDAYSYISNCLDASFLILRYRRSMKTKDVVPRSANNNTELTYKTTISNSFTIIIHVNVKLINTPRQSNKDYLSRNCPCDTDGQLLSGSLSLSVPQPQWAAFRLTVPVYQPLSGSLSLCLSRCPAHCPCAPAAVRLTVPGTRRDRPRAGLGRGLDRRR